MIIPLISAFSINNPTLPKIEKVTTAQDIINRINYSNINVNDSQYLQGYTWATNPFFSNWSSTYNSTYALWAYNQSSIYDTNPLWLRNGNNIYNNNSGNVGIGVGGSPAYALDVAGEGRFTKAQNGDTFVRVYNSNGGSTATAGFQANNNWANTYFLIHGSNVSTSAYVRGNGTLVRGDGAGVDIAATAANSDMRFWTSGSERMRINATGNVGIGTTNPSKTLHVSTGAEAVPNDGVGIKALIQAPNSNYGVALGLSTDSVGRGMSLFTQGFNTTTGVRLGFNLDESNGAGVIQVVKNGTASAGNIGFQASGGNVGIGTNTPANKLNVIGDANITTKTTVNNMTALANVDFTSGTRSDNGLTISRTYDGARMRFAYGSNVGYGEIGHVYAAVGKVNFWIGANLDSSGYAHKGIVRSSDAAPAWFTSYNTLADTYSIQRIPNTTTTATTLFYINGSGYTGIGTTTPSHKLNVVGDTNITGNLIVDGNFSAKRPYGMYSSTEDQTLALADTAYPVTFNWTEDSYLITKQGNSNFSVAQSGDYLVELSAIFQTGVANKRSNIWVQIYNSTGSWNNVPRSNTQLLMRTINSDYVTAVPFILDINSNEKFRIMWAGDDASVFMNYMTNTSYAPETPSIIMTISKISDVTV